MFNYTYPPFPLKRYFPLPMIDLIVHLYRNYTRISAADLAVNDTHLQEAYNANDPLQSLYERLNKREYYAAVTIDTITEGQIVWIAFGLVYETRKYIEDFHIWRLQPESDRTYTYFQDQFIEAQEYLW